jgi:hypothetical protein
MGAPSAMLCIRRKWFGNTGRGRDRRGGNVTRWAVFWFAVIFSGSYLAWIVAFERRFEPWLRRRVSAVLRCSIVWVPAGGPFRMWGLQGAKRHLLEAKVGLAGSATMLCAAVLPAVGMGMVIRTEGSDAAVGSVSYLMSLPMVVCFLGRVLSGRPDTP